MRPVSNKISLKPKPSWWAFSHMGVQKGRLPWWNPSYKFAPQHLLLPDIKISTGFNLSFWSHEEHMLQMPLATNTTLYGTLWEHLAFTAPNEILHWNIWLDVISGFLVEKKTVSWAARSCRQHKRHGIIPRFRSRFTTPGFSFVASTVSSV